jgi:glutaredoxin
MKGTAMITRAVMYTKRNCKYCTDAMVELHNHNIPVQQLVVGYGVTTEELMQKVPDATTVPQIFVYNEDNDETYVGGYTELVAFLQD